MAIGTVAAIGAAAAGKQRTECKAPASWKPGLFIDETLFLDALAEQVAPIAQLALACEQPHQARPFRLWTADAARQSMKADAASVFHQHDSIRRIEQARGEGRCMTG